jgi:membrane associated rhomboid family serine protease
VRVCRPCCTDIYGTCQTTTESYCNFIGGYFHSNAETCEGLSCLSSVCGFGGLSDPSKPNQGYRFILPIFLHVGILHYLFNALFQLAIGRQIERTAGWLRTALIYFIAGLGGNLCSGIFVPYVLQVGASGALYGLLGVLVVELFQSWQLLDHPYMELIKLVFIVGVSLLVGTLPWVDNFAHIGGFVCGILAAVVFLPYVVFGKWDRRRKLFLILICAPILLLALILAFIIFYTGLAIDCSWCNYVDCVDYTPDFCSSVAGATTVYG